jgi:hypothetical protein
MHGVCCYCLQVSHVMLDPLRRDQLAVLPLHRFRAAIVLADDDGWGTSSEGTDDHTPDQRANTDAIDQPSVLRQDALMVMVQVSGVSSTTGVALESGLQIHVPHGLYLIQ